MLILPRRVAGEPAEPSWHMQPLSDAVAGMPAGLHVVYRSSDVVPLGTRCGTDDSHIAQPVPEVAPVLPLAQRLEDQLPGSKNTLAEKGGHGGGEGGSPEVPNIRCEIAFDTDVEFYQANGSSIYNTVYDIELVMNQVGLVYQNQTAIAYTETGIILNTAEPDPYSSTNPTTLLCQMRDYWNNVGPLWRDVAHLFTGKDLDGTTIGLATINGICNGSGNLNGCSGMNHNDYGHVQSRYSAVLTNRVGLSAHELGHNWSCCHCDQTSCSNPPIANCGIMNSTANGSLTFESFSLNRILAESAFITVTPN
jgi:hypothetical protein